MSRSHSESGRLGKSEAANIVSISLERKVLIIAAIFGIPGSIAGIFYVLGIYTSLRFAWMTPLAPYIYSCIAFGVFMVLAALILDYVTIRRAALGPHPASVDPSPLVQAEEKARAQAIEAVYNVLYDNIGRINQSLNDLAPKQTAEPPLKQRTTELANDLFALLKAQGPQPPEPLSLPRADRNTVAKQMQSMHAYFDWQRRTYYQYMAFFRDRVIKTDYELAAAGIQTKLTRPELDPLTKEVMENHDVDIKKIAEALLLTANHMSD